MTNFLIERIDIQLSLKSSCKKIQTRKEASMKKITSVFTLAVAAVLLTSVQAQVVNPNTRDEQDVLKIERQWGDALLRGDADALQKILPDDYTLTGPDGKVYNKAQEIANHRTGDLKFESFATDEIKARIYVGGAVVTGRAVLKGKFKDQDISGEYRFIDVFESRKNTWYPVVSQLTKIVKEQPRSKPDAL